MRMKNKILLGVSGVKGVKAIVFLFLSLLMILPLSSCYNKENREEILKVYSRPARKSESSTRPSTSMR